MKHKIIIAVIFAGLIGFALLGLTGGQKVTWTTTAGEERGIAMPRIPGMKLIS